MQDKWEQNIQQLKEERTKAKISLKQVYYLNNSNFVAENEKILISELDNNSYDMYVIILGAGIRKSHILPFFLTSYFREKIKVICVDPVITYHADLYQKYLESNGYKRRYSSEKIWFSKSTAKTDYTLIPCYIDWDNRTIPTNFMRAIRRLLWNNKKVVFCNFISWKFNYSFLYYIFQNLAGQNNFSYLHGNSDTVIKFLKRVEKINGKWITEESSFHEFAMPDTLTQLNKNEQQGIQYFDMANDYLI